MGWYERGDFFHCPNCGMKHSKHVAYVKRDEPAPNQVRLTVKTFQNAVVFEATSKTVEFRDLLRVHEGKRKEIFRFDIAKQSVSFTYFNNGCEIESMEIGDPFKLGVLEKSMLGFFYSNSLANSRQKTELSKRACTASWKSALVIKWPQCTSALVAMVCFYSRYSTWLIV